MLDAQNIQKQFDGQTILDDVSLSVQQGEVLSILGRSGCGKTTLLKIIAGLLPQDGGTVKVSGEAIDALPPQLRHIVYLYQEPLLFPHLNVAGNLAFGLKLRKEPADSIRRKVAQIAEELELAEHVGKMPSQISGGQRQRVAFGRALILNPRVLLLDEPFGALDAQTRVTMQALFQKAANEHRITAIFVTHDLKEALIVGNRFGLMEAGRLAIYEDRAAFIADPKSGIGTELDFWQNLRGPGGLILS